MIGNFELTDNLSIGWSWVGIQILHKTISKNHATIKLIDNQLYLDDNFSKYGIFFQLNEVNLYRGNFLDLMVKNKIMSIHVFDMKKSCFCNKIRSDLIMMKLQVKNNKTLFFDNWIANSNIIVSGVDEMR